MNDVDHLRPDRLEPNTNINIAKNMRNMMVAAMDMCCALSCMGC